MNAYRIFVGGLRKTTTEESEVGTAQPWVQSEEIIGEVKHFMYVMCSLDTILLVDGSVDV